jgi:hypothetical protein
MLLLQLEVELLEVGAIMVLDDNEASVVFVDADLLQVFEFVLVSPVSF